MRVSVGRGIIVLVIIASLKLCVRLQKPKPQTLNCLESARGHSEDCCRQTRAKWEVPW